MRCRSLAFNAATPFITPDPPWLSDVPVVFAIMMLLIIMGCCIGFRMKSDESA